MSSPNRKRLSITAASFNSIDHHAVDLSGTSPGDSSASAATVTFTHQQSVDVPSSSNLKSINLTSSEISGEADEIKAESLEKILENKLIREKREALEKKLKSLRKAHDKEKLKLSTQRGTDATDGSTGSAKKSKFYMGNKLVKRLSSKNMWVKKLFFY